MQSMDEIYKQYAKTVYKFLMSRTHNEDLAEELTQETFFQAIRSIGKYDYSCSISTWLCAIAKTKYLEYIRKHPHYEDIYEADNLLSATSGAEADYMNKLEWIELIKKLHSLPEPFKEIMYLRLFGNLSFSEIGKIMEKNENWVRMNFYQGKERLRKRQYEAVEELPPGKQGQVDIGEISVETASGRFKKLYCFGMVLSHSRQKFVLWQEHPFTTDSFIIAHEKAFAFYGGRPREIVYDQDKILAVSENHGDIIYTEGFQNYLNELKFDVFLCHGADPESKGKVENVVKYAKHGFAEHRIFADIDSFNTDCIAWLNRTGNAKEHGTIKKIPAEVFAVEKEYLIPVPTYSFAATDKESITYQVRKGNIVLYKGNRYRVPKGTYSPGKKVFMVVNDDIISITDCLTGEIYATHPLCHEKGMLIGQKRDERDKSKSLLELEELVQELFENDEIVMPFLNHIHREKPRYYRDQLGVIRKLFEEWNKEAVMDGLRYCCERELYSASELKSSIIYLNQICEAKETKKIKPVLPSKYRGSNPQKRDLCVYEEAMERGVVNG